MVNSIPTLIALDEYVITDEERIEKSYFIGRFKSMSPKMMIKQIDNSKVTSAEKHLFNLEV